MPGSTLRSALPRLRRCGVRRRVARERLDQPGGRARQGGRTLRPPSGCRSGQQIGAGPEGSGGRPCHDALDQRLGPARRQAVERGEDGRVVTLVVVACRGDFGQEPLDQRRVVQPGQQGEHPGGVARGLVPARIPILRRPLREHMSGEVMRLAPEG